MAESGFGMSITFASGYFAAITSIRRTGVTREALETTHMTSTEGYRTFMPSDLIDEGSYEVDLQLDADTAVPIASATGAFTVTYPVKAGETTGATVAGNGFLTDYSEDLPIDGIMTASATFKITGKTTRTAGT